MDKSFSFLQDESTGDTDMTMALQISNVLNESVSLYPFIHKIGEKLHLSQACVGSLVIALEEQLINVVRYAYPRGEQGVITLKAVWHKTTSTLRFTMIDHGVAYNPTEVRVEHHSDRPMGAVGINMLAQLMDTVDYVRRAGANILQLTKKIPGLKNKA